MLNFLGVIFVLIGWDDNLHGFINYNVALIIGFLLMAWSEFRIRYDIEITKTGDRK